MTQGSKSRKLRKPKSEGSSLKQSATSKSSTWGPFQPAYDSINAIVRRVKPLFSVYSIVVGLLFLLTIAWFGNARVRRVGPPFPPSRIGINGKVPYASRVTVWEDLWLNEEEALWEWLQDRTGLAEGFAFPLPSSSSDHDNSDAPGSAPRSGRSRKRSNNDRDLQWAIKITEDRLALLKEKVGGSQETKSTAKPSSLPTPHDSV